MIVAIHQPNFIPWIGYFYKIFKADTFVLLDNVQYSKNSFINRNKIKTPRGDQWLTIPVLHRGNFGQLINEVEILNPVKSLSKIKSSIKANYGRAVNFNKIYSFIEPLLYEQTKLIELNELIIRAVVEYLGISTEIINASVLEGIEGTATYRLVNICKKLDADVYLAGFGSVNYQDNKKFETENIKCKMYNFVHPVYPQLWNYFVPNMSILDLLFNNTVEDVNSILRGIDENY